MKSLSVGYAGFLLAAVVMLAGCGAPPQVQRVAAPAMPQLVDRGQRPDRGGSWMTPDKKKKQGDLLYIGDIYSNDVFVFSYPSGAEVGILTGFDEPYDMCVDKKGDVFITNFASGTVVEYAHGGTSPLQTLETGGLPIGCAVSPSGDLAVSNLSDSEYFEKYSPGSEVIFKGATGSGTAFSNETDCYYLYPGAYDQKGNLWIESTKDSGYHGVCELAAGGDSLTLASFNHFISSPGAAMWDGKYVVLGDQEYNGEILTALYQATPSGSGLIWAGTTVLNDDCGGDYISTVVGPFIVGKKNTPANVTQGTRVVGSNLVCSDIYGKPKIDSWQYPAGGLPVRSMLPAINKPVGAAVSIGK